MRKQGLTFPAGGILKIVFEPFSVEIAFEEQRFLTVKVTEGDNAGFSDTIPYEAEDLGNQLYALSWQETIGTSVVHMLNLQNATSLTFVTPRNGGLQRLSGRIDASMLTLP